MDLRFLDFGIDSDYKKHFGAIRNSEFFNVARPGFEPRQTVPKTVVLPLYYRAISKQKRPFEMVCKYRAIKSEVQKYFAFLVLI